VASLLSLFVCVTCFSLTHGCERRGGPLCGRLWRRSYRVFVCETCFSLKCRCERSRSRSTCVVYGGVLILCLCVCLFLFHTFECLWGVFVWGFGVLFLSCVCVSVSGVLFSVGVCVTC